MNNAQMIVAMATLPDPDMLAASKIDDPLGSGAYYRADNVVRLLAKERETSDRLRAWVEEAIGYVESPMFSPSLADEGKALLTPNVELSGPTAALSPEGPAQTQGSASD